VLSTANIGIKAVIPAIHASSNGRLVALASRDLARAERVLAGDVGARAFGSYEALLDDSEVEAVYIPLPNSMHLEWAIRAAAKGKHVLCEKPLGTTPDEALRMIEACRAAGVLLLEAFMYRFHPQIRWTLDQLAADAIGPVRLVRSAFAFDIRTRPENIRLNASLGGGSLMDVGCYPLNFSRAVYGGPPRSVTAHVDVPSGSEVEQSIAAVLDFGEGQLAMIDASFQMPWHQFAEVVGESGRIVLPRPYTPSTSETIVRIERGDETLERHFDGVDQYRLEIEHFSECIRNNAALDISPGDALEQAETLDAVYRAAEYTLPW
jgi:predicted dehydrogenase